MANPNHTTFALVSIIAIVALVGFVGIMTSQTFLQENLLGQGVAIEKLSTAPAILEPESEYLPLYRFWRPGKDHFYTTKEGEKNAVQQGGVYRYEKIEAYVFRKPTAGAQALHRFWSSTLNDHFYTADQQEYLTIKRNTKWRYEGVIGYVYAQQQAGTVALHRLFNPTINDHFYTISGGVVNNQPNGWNYEHIVGYVYAQEPQIIQASGSLSAGPCEATPDTGRCSALISWGSEDVRTTKVQIRINTANDGEKIFQCKDANTAGQKLTGEWIGPSGKDFRMYTANDCTMTQTGTLLAQIHVNNTPAPTEAEVAAPWIIKLSSTGQEVKLHFGEYGDTAVPGDYDGDGVTDLAVWRRYKTTAWKGVNSKWIIHLSSTDTIEERNFGDASNLKRDWPVQADYDGDGITDMAYFREANNVWTIKQSSNGQTVTRTWDPWNNGIDDFKFGWYGHWTQTSAVPVAADFDGDGQADLMAFRAYDARWKIQKSSDGSTITRTFGKAGVNDGGWKIYDMAIPADYDGDGQAELATRRPKEGLTKVKGGFNGIFGSKFAWPVAGDFDGDGRADVGVFHKQPELDFSIITTDMTATGVDWPLRESSPQIMDDDGTYRMISCGNSHFYNMPDAVWYSKSDTSATSGYGEKRQIILDACHSSFIKVPANINPTFSNACGASNDVYLLYTEADSFPRPGVDMNKMATPSYFDGRYKCRPRDMVNNKLRNLCDYSGAPSCCNLPKFPLQGYVGNAIVLYYSCNPDASNEPWTRVGQVIELDQPVPTGSKEGNPYGEGHPNAQFLNGKVYVTHYSHNNNADGSLMYKHSALATAADGVHFTKLGRVQGTVGQEIQYLEEANMFLGVGVASGTRPVYFAKDLGNQEHWVLYGVWEHLKEDWSAPITRECGMSPGFVRNEYGIIEGESPIVLVEQWDANTACQPLSDGNTWSLNGGDPIVSRVNLDIEQSKCLGSAYRGCQSGVQERTCTATGWSDWGTCS